MSNESETLSSALSIGWIEDVREALCPSSNKWDRCSVKLSECFAHQFNITRRVVDSANDVSRWSFS